ncbi:MAG TPA: 50S ribosomal protein L9 [Rhizomicrobium sp.]|jgi:large subunit ribosomal protein L9|nr:50S ribosomal protein L9 [Rhizomicrobium sp.]
MQVILLERVEKLGQMGDEVKVKDGFARNYLLPHKKALRANKANREYFLTQKTHLEAHNLERKKDADAIAKKLEGKTFVLLRQAGDRGQLYGSVSPRDISDVITAGGFEISRTQVPLDKAIKDIGLFPVSVVLHPEVRVSVTINVARTEDEAERQARGEDVLSERDAEEEAKAEAKVAAEELFEEGAGPKAEESAEGETAEA